MSNFTTVVLNTATTNTTSTSTKVVNFAKRLVKAADKASYKACNKAFDVAVQNPEITGVAVAATLFVSGVVGCHDCIKHAESLGFSEENPMPINMVHIGTNVKFGMSYLTMATAFYNGYKAYEVLSEMKASAYK